MKHVPLRPHSKAVLMEILRLSPHKAIDLDEMRKRVRVMDALDKATDVLEIEDADYDILARALKEFPYQVASREAVEVADDVRDARRSEGNNAQVN